MAKVDEFSKSSSNLFIKTSEEFEKCVKTRLGWSKKQWLSAGESSTRINKLINSFNYWKSKLKPALIDNSIVFTLFNVEKDVRTELIQIIEGIEKLNPSIKVQGYSDFRNPRYLCIYLKDKEERDFVVNNFKMLDDCFIAYLHWAFERDNNVVSLKVHWLPRAFQIADIEKALEKYVKCIEHERYQLPFMSGRNMPSGKVVFKAIINEGYVIENIPHVMNVKNMEALVTVPGRLPLCLNCEQLGHISKKCKMRYCAVCENLKTKEHECMTAFDKTTYASKVKGKDEQLIRADDEDWQAAIVTNDLSVLDKAKTILAEKIAVLEEKVNGNECSNTLDFPAGVGNRSNGEDRESLHTTIEVSSFQEAESSSDQDDSMDLSITTVEKKADAEGNIVSVEDYEQKTKKVRVANKMKKNQNKATKMESSKLIKLSIQAKKVSSNEDNTHGIRSYGKPVPNNLRKQKEERKFEKMMQNQEFVFTDQE